MLNIPFIWKRRITLLFLLFILVYFLGRYSILPLTKLSHAVEPMIFVLVVSLTWFILIGQSLSMEEKQEYYEAKKRNKD